MIEGEVVEIEIDRPATGSVAKTVRACIRHVHVGFHTRVSWYRRIFTLSMLVGK